MWPLVPISSWDFRVGLFHREHHPGHASLLGILCFCKGHLKLIWVLNLYLLNLFKESLRVKINFQNAPNMLPNITTYLSNYAQEVELNCYKNAIITRQLWRNCLELKCSLYYTYTHNKKQLSTRAAFRVHIRRTSNAHYFIFN